MTTLVVEKEKKKRKPLKPITALIPLNLDSHTKVKEWKEKGHTILYWETLDISKIHEIDAVIGPNVYLLLEDNQWMDMSKRMDVIEKSARAVKYKSKVKQ